MRGNACLLRTHTLDGRVTRRVLIFASVMAMAVPTWLERMMTLMRQTVQQQGIAPKPKPQTQAGSSELTKPAEQIFTGPKGGQYVLTASGKKKYLKK